MVVVVGVGGVVVVVVDVVGVGVAVVVGDVVGGGPFVVRCFFAEVGFVDVDF